MRVERLLIHAEAQHELVVARFRAAFPEARVFILKAESEARQYLSDCHKRTIYLGPRLSKFVSRFHPPRGMVCSTFWKFTAETECLYRCHYCYLALTMRMLPYVRVATNLNDGLREMEQTLKTELHVNRRAMFNIGELADGRLLDPLTELSRAVVPLLHSYPNGMLHVLTKSGTDTIDNYLDLSGYAPGQIIHVASVNPQSIIDLTESDTPPVLDRLMALRELQSAGYRIRLRIDPIFDLRDLSPSATLQEAFDAYDELIALIQKTIVPEMVTLGSYRPAPQLIPHIRRRYPHSAVLRVATQKEGVKKRTPQREIFYAHIAEKLARTFPTIHMALCKETSNVWRACGLEMKPLQCSCLPLADERHIEHVDPFLAIPAATLLSNVLGLEHS